MGTVIDTNATLANAGFATASRTGNFRINGQTITMDNTTTLNSLIASINGAGADVTATPGRRRRWPARTTASRSSRRPASRIQLGSLGDTSNGLRLLNLADAAITGYTASNTNSGMGADAGALNTSITINGVTTAINQADGGFSSAQNAQFIAQTRSTTRPTTRSRRRPSQTADHADPEDDRLPADDRHHRRRRRDRPRRRPPPRTAPTGWSAPPASG